jgi:uncharacterized membrane protein
MAGLAVGKPDTNGLILRKGGTTMAHRSLTVFTLLALTSFAHAQGTLYELTIVQPDPEATSTLRAINDFGVIAGTVQFPDPDHPEAVIENAFVKTMTSETILPPLPGFPGSRSSALLFHHFVVGNSVGENIGAPTLWLPSGSPRQLALLPDHDFGNAEGANGRAEIVGSSSGPATGPLPVKWGPGANMETLPTPDGFPNGSARDVNNAGVIIGSASSVDQAIGFVIDGEGNVVPFPQGFLTAINEENVAAGGSTGGPVMPLFYDVDQDVVTIPPLPVGFFAGGLNGLNDQGIGVGLMFGATGLVAMMTDGATTTDLNTVIEPGSGDGITLFSAFDVNNKGQIVGNAMNEAGQVLGFLLTPIGAMEAEGVGLQAPDRRGPRVTDVTAVREFLSNDPRVKAGL